MAVEATTAVRGYVTIPNGTTSSGATKYAQVSVGTINPEKFDMEKFYNVCDKLENCLEGTCEGFYYSKTNQVAEA